MKLNGVAYRDFRETGPRSFVCCLVYDNPDGLYGDHIKWVCRPVFLWYKLRFANPSDTMPAWSAHRLFLFKAFQPFLATYPDTFVLETLIDNVMLKFFYFSVLWNYLAYINSFFDDISHTVCEKTAIHSLVCLLRSLLLTTCSVIVQTSSTIWQFFWTEWPEDHKIRCLSSGTNSVGLHFHEGVEKIIESVKNTKTENLQKEQEKYGGKNLVYVYS